MDNTKTLVICTMLNTSPMQLRSAAEQFVRDGNLPTDFWVAVDGDDKYAPVEIPPNHADHLIMASAAHSYRLVPPCHRPDRQAI